MSDALVKAFERLANEVANLRRDTTRLHSRVAPEWGGDEPAYLSQSAYEARNMIYYGRPQPVTETEALALVKAIRDQIQGADYHLGAIRSHMDDICRDAISRAEMKPYLKD